MVQDTAKTLLQRLGQRDFDTHVTRGIGLTDDEVATVALQALHQARDADHHQISRDNPLNTP